MSGSTSHRDGGELLGHHPEADPGLVKPPAVLKVARRSSAAASRAVRPLPDRPTGRESKPPAPVSPRASAGTLPGGIPAVHVADPNDADSNDADSNDADSNDANGDSLLAAVWRNSASWLVSAVFHLVLMLVMTLTWITFAPEQEDRSLMAQIEGLDMEELDVSTLHDQLDDVELQQADALPVGIDDPGMAALGEVRAVDLEPVAEAGQLASLTSLGEIGTLFGDDGQGWTTAGEGMGGAEFYGVRARGNRFVFVVDGSQSMGKQQKWPSCKRELLAAVSKLSPKQHFYVYLFARDTYRMFGKVDPADRMMPATPQNIYRLRRWLDKYQLQLGTVPHGALKETLQKLRPDAVYLLSDGQFTDRGGSEQYLLNFARTKNNAKGDETGSRYRVAVHTIAFASRRGEIVLRRIAGAFDSTFRYVPARK